MKTFSLTEAEYSRAVRKTFAQVRRTVHTPQASLLPLSLRRNNHGWTHTPRQSAHLPLLLLHACRALRGGWAQTNNRAGPLGGSTRAFKTIVAFLKRRLGMTDAQVPYYPAPL